MFDFLFPNHPFGGHTLRLVAQAQQGGADVFDIARAMKNVEAGDKDAWERLVELPNTEARAKEALTWSSRHGAAIFFHATIITACPCAFDHRRRIEARPTVS